MDVKVVIAVILLLFFLIKTGLFAKIINFLVSTNYYKRRFVKFESDLPVADSSTDSPLYAIKKTFYAQIEKTLEELPGKVLEIGAGVGPSLHFLRLPQGCSLVVVDYNPHFEQHFRERLAKFPDIKLQDYLVQSAVDMSNIPDNSFSVVLVSDVLCSIDEDSLRTMLKEIKRVLKRDGCFYFLEHVLDKPGSWRRFLQKLICWSYIWPGLFDNCHCDRETWHFIEEAGFRSVTLSYSYLPWPTKGGDFDKCFIYFIQYFLSGHAKK